MRRFSPAERELVHRAMHEAEERTARYYCFPPHRWQDLRFDLLTRRDREWQPLPPPVLARLQRLVKLGAIPGRSYDFYRIQLNDPAILDVFHRRDFDAELYPFLVYILTHEMVHLVRLSSILEEEAPAAESPAAEEERVDRISRQILCSAPRMEIDPIISKFTLRINRDAHLFFTQR
jgi:hypothetical protein